MLRKLSIFSSSLLYYRLCISQRLLYSYFNRELIGNQQRTKNIRVGKTVTSGKQNISMKTLKQQYTIDIYFLSNLLDIELRMYVASIYISCFKRCK